MFRRCRRTCCAHSIAFFLCRTLNLSIQNATFFIHHFAVDVLLSDLCCNSPVPVNISMFLFLFQSTSSLLSPDLSSRVLGVCLLMSNPPHNLRFFRHKAIVCWFCRSFSNTGRSCLCFTKCIRLRVSSSGLLLASSLQAAGIISVFIKMFLAG